MRVIRMVVLIAALAASACTPAGGDAEIVIGAVYPTGGSHGTGGIEEWWGAELAAEYANLTADRRVRLELVPAETADSAPGAVRRLQQMGAAVVIGSYGSTISRTAAATASELGIVYWETGAVGDLSMRSSLGDRVFRVPAAGGILGRQAVDFVRDDLGMGSSRWAVAYVDDVYGRSVGLGAIEQAESAGDPVVARIAYDPHSADYGAMAGQVADSGADALAVAAYLDDGVAIRRAMLAHRVPLRASIGTSSSFCMIEFGKRLGDQAVGLLASDKPSGDAMNPENLTPDAAAALRWARERYRQRHAAGMTAPALSGFAASWALFHHVLPRAEQPSPDAIARAAVSTKVVAGGLPNGSGLDLAGPHESDPGSNRAAATVIWQWVAPETREIVWPPAFSTHPIVAPVP